MPQVDLTPEEIAELINWVNYAKEVFEPDDLLFLSTDEKLEALKEKLKNAGRIKPEGTAVAALDAGVSGNEAP
jgi:hypothetical protein